MTLLFYSENLGEGAITKIQVSIFFEKQIWGKFSYAIFY
jgi:hypothetical protein